MCVCLFQWLAVVVTILILVKPGSHRHYHPHKAGGGHTFVPSAHCPLAGHAGPRWLWWPPGLRGCWECVVQRKLHFDSIHLSSPQLPLPAGSPLGSGAPCPVHGGGPGAPGSPESAHVPMLTSWNHFFCTLLSHVPGSGSVYFPS